MDGWEYGMRKLRGIVDGLGLKTILIVMALAVVVLATAASVMVVHVVSASSSPSSSQSYKDGWNTIVPGMLAPNGFLPNGPLSPAQAASFCSDPAPYGQGEESTWVRQLQMQPGDDTLQWQQGCEAAAIAGARTYK
jgi:hypothetical protein